jgi:hypothetical protein
MDLSEKIESMKFARETTPASNAVPSHPNMKRKSHDENYKTNKCGEDLGCPVKPTSKKMKVISK